MKRPLVLLLALSLAFAGCGPSTNPASHARQGEATTAPATGSGLSESTNPLANPAPNQAPADGTVSIKPDGQINSVAFAPDGRTLATGMGDGSVVLWDPATGQKRSSLQGHDSGVTAVAYSPDGTRLATSGGQDGTVKVWDVAAGKALVSLKVPTGPVVSSVNLAFSPDGATLAAGYGDAAVRLWDVARGEGTAALQGHAYPVVGVAFSADGKLLASGGSDGTVRLWNPATGRPLKTVQGPLRRIDGRAGPAPLDSVTLSPDGKVMATECTDNAPKASMKDLDEKTVFLWNLPVDRPYATLRGHTNSGAAVAFSPDSKTLALAAEEGTYDQNRHVVNLWDTATGRELGTAATYENTVQYVLWSPDGKTLATGDGSEVRLRPVSRPAVPPTGGVTPAPAADSTRQEGHTGAVYCLAFAPDGKTVASGSEDGTIKLWDVSTGHPRSTINVVTDAIRGLAYSPDGKTLAAACTTSKSVRFWDPETGQERGGALRGHIRDVLSVAYSPDGQTLASGSLDLTIRLWDPASGMVRAVLNKQSTPVQFVVFSPDGRTLAAPNQWEINLYDVGTGQVRAVCKAHRDNVTSAAFTPDGRALVTGSTDRNKPVLLWRADTGTMVGQLKADLDGVTALALSPDGKILATGGTRLQENRPHLEVTLWDVATGKELAPLQWHTVQITSVVFSPDGKTLVSASYDKTVKFWDVPKVLAARSANP